MKFKLIFLSLILSQLTQIIPAQEAQYTDSILDLNLDLLPTSSFLSNEISISFEDANLTGIYNSTDALQGRISGLDIISTYNGPGAGFEENLRSQSTLRNAPPLIVIDGVPQIRYSMEIAPYSENRIGFSNPLAIAIDDIASISVLNDAAATAFYGSEGVNGILLIETKKSQPGKFNVNYGYTYGHSFKPATLPMLSGEEYVALQLEALYNKNGVFDSQPELAYDRDFEDFYNYSANTNWVEEVTKPGQTQNHYIGMNGSFQKTDYGITFNHMNQTGNIISTGYDHSIIHAKLNHRFSEKLSVALQSRIIKRKYDDNFQVENELGAVRPVLDMAYKLAPNRSIWEYDKDGSRTGEYFTPIQDYQGTGLQFYNPIAVANLGEANKKVNENHSVLTVSYQPLKWLRFSEQITHTTGKWDYSAFLPYNAIGIDWLNTGYKSHEQQTIDYMQFNNRMGVFISSPQSTSPHSFTLGGIWLVEYNTLENDVWEFNSNQSIPQATDPIFGSVVRWVNGPFMGEKLIHSGVFTADYQLLDKYLFAATFRLEKPTIAGINLQNNSFLGISCGWEFSKERFLKNLNFLNKGMITAGYTYRQHQIAQKYSSPSSDIVKNEFRGGIDLSLFKNSLYIKTDFFTSIIASTPAFSAFKESTDYKSLGIETMLEYLVVDKQNWKAYFNINISYLKKKIKAQSISATPGTSRGYQTMQHSGAEPGNIYGLNYIGIFPTDDDAIAYDANGEIITDNSGIPVDLTYSNSYIFSGGDTRYEDQDFNGVIDSRDFIYLGNTTPDFIGGFGSRIMVRQFELSLQFHYRLGYKIINNMALLTSRTDQVTNQSKAVLSRWHVQGQDEPGMLPRAYINHPANFLPSDNYVESGDFVELNYCNISYHVPGNFLEKIKMKSLILGISAQRLFSISNYSGFDSEISRHFWNINEHHPEDNIRLPSPKVVSFSIQVGF